MRFALKLVVTLAFAFGVGVELAASVVEWDFPREGSCHEGLPFADGSTGVLVWGGGDTMKLTVGRADLWDHRGGYPWTIEQSYTNIVALVQANEVAKLKSLFRREVPKNWNPDGNPFTDRFNPYLLPLGRVVITLEGASLKRGLLDTETGIGRILLADERELTMAMSVERRVFAMKLPKGLSAKITVVPSSDFPIYANKLKGRGFEAAVKRESGFSWALPADRPVSLDCVKKATGDGDELLLWTSRTDQTQLEMVESLRFSAVASASVEHWRAFWTEGARVKVPDAVLQQVFDFGMYKFGAMTEPTGVPAGLQGVWLEDDQLVPWNGDYHFNVNVQECYSPAYRGGHFKHLLPLFKMVLSWRPILRDNAKKFVGIDDGYVLPHSVDDRGVCIGGFWTGTIDHASTAWVADMMFRYVKYSGDVAFLKGGAYDYMKGAMRVYRAMMEEREGRLSLPLGPSPEWGAADARKAVGRDPSFQLAAAHRLARDLIAAAKLVGETPDPMWGEVERRLPAYTNGGQGFELFVGQPFVKSHRHHSHMAGIYPFDTIDFGNPNDLNAATRTYRNWVYMGSGEWSGWCVPWAAIIHTHFGNARAAVQAIHNWEAFFTNPGHGSLHDSYAEGFTIFTGRKTIMQMDGQCGAATAVMELMAHEVNGKVEFFKGCPLEWKDVSFENLALSDGRRVNGRRQDGIVTITEAKAR